MEKKQLYFYKTWGLDFATGLEYETKTWGHSCQKGLSPRKQKQKPNVIRKMSDDCQIGKSS